MAATWVSTACALRCRRPAQFPRARTVPSPADAQTGGVLEYLNAQAVEEGHLEHVRPDAAIRPAARELLRSEHAGRKLRLGDRGHHVLRKGRRVAAAGAEADFALAAAGGHVEGAGLDLVPGRHDVLGLRVGAEVEALRHLAFSVQEAADDEGHAAFGMIRVPRASVGVRKLDAHPLAHAIIEVRRLVGARIASRRQVALVPRVRNESRVVAQVAARLVDGQLLEEASGVLSSARVELAMQRVRVGPLRGGQKAVSRTASLEVPASTVEAPCLDLARKALLVVDAAPGHRHLARRR